ncbi:ATP phosphoribosyltransferase regulatory subunit [Mediterraneibacter glycyrrhizinilyticus]|uniref:ATP phosphoribosyltransferase regulatory subunit n=1 Tax=Mediterraneibacter glycyrrhizinilyticus TaxID=342942 RepID=UPI0025A4C43E|nr:ATP phosphoribosyltransferase regulatory subunit [Mediterraneibacter glycyrrhizinilyticus]MDM8210596.1 ATP phosphoribosyltransferase regulatory subunit [Mediterraneibacter glycyrrhizinilyticus]
MEQKLHTPEGVRDIYNKECETKLALQKKLNTVLHLYGYKDIQTPTFEYYDVFREEIGSTSTQELYKFFDREGNILALRPDITPSIARAAATLFENEDFPIRLCYAGNTFINHSSYQGRLKENTQLGAELIGLDAIEADAEMIAMVVDGLKKTGLKEFQVSIGHVDFIQGLMNAADLQEEESREVRTLITNRNFFGVEELLDSRNVKSNVKEAFRILPELVGGPEVLDEALRIAPDLNARLGVARLQQIYRLLKLYGTEDHITFDLSMSGSYGYYTGIIFRAYTYGTGDAVVRGGRYDHLLAKFGKDTPSIGFAIILDELMNALNRQKISVDTVHQNLIVYTEETEKRAIALACSFREKGRNIELIKRETEEERDIFEAYARRTGASALLYLRDDEKIEMVNLKTGEEKIADI